MTGHWRRHEGLRLRRVGALTYLLVHSITGDHFEGYFRGALEIVGRAGGYVAVEHQLLGRTAAHEHGNAILQIRLTEQEAILGRTLDGVTERTDAARNNGDLMHRIDAGQRRRYQRVAHLVISDAAPLILVEHPALFLQTGNDAFDRFGEVGGADRSTVAPCGDDGGFVYQVGDIGPGKAGRHSGDRVKIEIWRKLHLAAMNS